MAKIKPHTPPTAHHSFTFDLEDSQRKEVAAIADRLGLSLSQVMRCAVWWLTGLEDQELAAALVTSLTEMASAGITPTRKGRPRKA